MFKKSQIVGKIGPRVTPSRHALVEAMALRCMKELSKKEYELPPLNRRLVVQTSDNGMSRGGLYRVKINVTHYGCSFTEYASIAQDPIIGSIGAIAMSGNPEAPLFAVVAHEVAHHIQWDYMKRQGIYHRPHGDGWRRIYGWLRRSLVNPTLVSPV